MSDPTPSQQRLWAEQWRAAEIELAQQRWREIREADLRVIAEQLDDFFLKSLQSNPPAPVSGLIEQQRLFHSRRIP